MATVANHDLIRLVRFISQISTHLSKIFYNKFYLILLNDKIPIDVTGAKKKLMKTNRANNGGSKSM